MEEYPERQVEIRKDSLETIVKIMEFVGERQHYPEGKKVCQRDISNKFDEKQYGKNVYWLFHQFCGIGVGGGETGLYAKTTPSQEKDNNNIEIRLTSEGIQKLFGLKELLAEHESAKWTKGGIVANIIFGVINLLVLLVNLKNIKLS